MYAHNDALQFSDKLTKLIGPHNMKFGFDIERGQKQQNFQNLEAGQLWFGVDNTEGTGNSGADMLVGRVGIQSGHCPHRQSGSGRTLRRVPFLENRRLCPGQLEGAVEPDARVRRALRLLDEQRRAGRPRRLLHAGPLRPDQGLVPGSGTFQRVNGVCYVETGCALDGVFGNRDPFALPRVNAAWDIDGEGNNVLRGGYGIFYNRNMGNVEYDTSFGWRPTPTRSPPISGPAATTGTASA